jgi:outer membrane protein assembly factor BamB
MTRTRRTLLLLAGALLAATTQPVLVMGQSSSAPCAAPAVTDPPAVAVPGGDSGNGAAQPGPLPSTAPVLCWTGAIGNPISGTAFGAVGDTAISSTDAGEFVAFGHDGTERWRYRAGDSQRAARGLALSAETAYVTTPTAVAAVSVADGTETWRHDLPPTTGPMAAVVDAFGGFGITLMGSTLVATTATTADASSGATDQGLLALDAMTGASLWTASLGTEGASGAPVTDGTIVAVAAADGDIHAFDLATGAAAWTAGYDILEATPATNLAFASGLLLVGLMDSSVVALSTADGSVAWHSPATDAAEVPLGLAAAGDVAYLNTGLQLIRFDTRTGATPWGATLQEGAPMMPFRATPAIVDGGVVVGTTDVMDTASLVAVSDAGTELWRSPTELYGAILSPVVLGGRVIAPAAGLMDGGLLTFGAP